MNIFDAIRLQAGRQFSELLAETKARLRRIESHRRSPSFQIWLQIARTTLVNRDVCGFHSDDCAEAMADAADAATLCGEDRDGAIDAMIAAYNRNFFYSTPHEHPCDEWPIRAIREAA